MSEVIVSYMNMGLNIQMLDKARHPITLSEYSDMINKNLVVASPRKPLYLQVMQICIF
jgi:hypothetical protein